MDLQKIFKTIKTFFQELNIQKKIILISSIALFILLSFILFRSSAQKEYIVLFKNLETKNFASITTKLSELGYSYKTSSTDTIFVSIPEKDKILVALAQDDLIPIGVYGWELFDQDKWSETQFEKDVKLQRAMMGNLAIALATLKNIDKASVNLAFPPDELFQDEAKPVTAAVMLRFSPGVEKLSEREIRGIVKLVSRSIPGLSEENVSISDSTGKIINNYDDEVTARKWEIEEVRKKLKIQEQERIKLLADIRKSLQSAFSEDRVDIVRLDVKLLWDEEYIEKNEVEPVVMNPDNPETPYSEREVKDSLQVSSKTTSEKFKGHGFTPEGPAGIEPNIPPGYKDRDYQRAEYDKKETINNNEFNKTYRKIKKQPWSIQKVNLAVLIDGRWERMGIKPDKSGYIRKYYPVANEELSNLTRLFKSAIGFDSSRKDSIYVQHLQKDRSKTFEMEDSLLRKRFFMNRVILISAISFFGLILLGAILYYVRKEWLRRKRIMEEEFAIQQKMMQEAAKDSLLEENIEVEIPLEKKIREEMLQNIIEIIKEKPEETAKLLSNWLILDEDY